MIPNIKHYCRIMDLWISGGLSNIKTIETGCKTLYRLIRKFGKVYNVLYMAIPKNIIKDRDYISFDLISTTNKKIKLNSDKFYMIKLKNCKGIAVSDLGYNNGFLYSNEIITFGKFQISSIKNNIITMIKCNQNSDDLDTDYENLINRVKSLANNNINVDVLTNKIENSKKKVMMNIDKLKELVEKNYGK